MLIESHWITLNKYQNKTNSGSCLHQLSNSICLQCWTKRAPLSVRLGRLAVRAWEQVGSFDGKCQTNSKELFLQAFKLLVLKAIEHGLVLDAADRVIDAHDHVIYPQLLSDSPLTIHRGDFQTILWRNLWITCRCTSGWSCLCLRFSLGLWW